MRYAVNEKSQICTYLSNCLPHINSCIAEYLINTLIAKRKTLYCHIILFEKFAKLHKITVMALQYVKFLYTTLLTHLIFAFIAISFANE